MDKLVIDDLAVQGKRVLTRVDFNVPIANGKVGDDSRIQAALPTINKVISDGGRLILVSHLGRPKGKPDPNFSLKPVAEHLTRVLGKDVQMADDCVGAGVEKQVAELRDGDVLLLENVRFHKEETSNETEFAKQLASHGEIFVNDAFGTAHRAHASTVGVAKIIKEAAAGYLLQSEVENLTKMLESPERPYVVILGGAKVSDKLQVIRNIITKVSAILVGGGMAYTFLKARGTEIGDSLLDQDSIPMAHNAMVVAKNPHPSKRLEFILPVDHTVASSPKDSNFQTSTNGAIAPGTMGVDIGPNTIAAFREKILTAKSIFWNGPMGIFENENFAKGTIEVAKAVAEATVHGAFSVIGGGDSVAALENAGVKDKISHVSTGGGASLEFMAGIELPGITALSKAVKKPEAAE